MATQFNAFNKPTEASIDSVNIWMRSTPWYQELMRAWKQDPGHPTLRKDQSAQLLKMAQSQGVVVNQGELEIDNHGNFNPKGHKLRNTLIVAGIAAATIATMGAAGAFAGAAAPGAASAGMGGAGAAGINSGLFAGSLGGAAGAGGAAGTMGVAGSSALLGAGGSLGALGASVAPAAAAAAAPAAVAPAAGGMALNAAGVPAFATSTGVSAAMPAAASTIPSALATGGTAIGGAGAALSSLGGDGGTPNDMADNSGQDVNRGDFGNEPDNAPNGNEEGFSQSGSKFADVKKWADRIKSVSDQFKGGSNPDNAPDVNTDTARDDRQLQTMSLNRRGDTEINQRGPASDQIALGNIMRSGNRANWKDVAPGADGQPGISIDPQTRAMYQAYNDEMKRRMSAGEPLTMSGVPKASPEEAALEASRRGARPSVGQRVQQGVDKFGNAINTGSRIIDLGSKIGSWFK